MTEVRPELGTFRLLHAFAEYFDSTALHVAALREGMLAALAVPGGAGRRQLLVTFRQNERLHQELTGRGCDDLRVRAALEELEALLARERGVRRARRRELA